MATTSEPIDNNVNKETEEKKIQSSSANDDQGSKTTEKVDDLNQVGKTDTLSSVQSTNEHNKSDQISPTSDTNTEKQNDEKKVDTTTTTSQKKEESGSSPSITNNNDNTFPIEEGDGQHLTDFQRQKAKYFFNVNLDIENKEYVTWEDVEFYLLFHITAAGKEGSDGGDLEGRLSRAARAFWEHVHDQVPLPDGKRDKLTLDQFLDTWASLIDYVIEKNQLPPIIQDLVKLGFELYSTDNTDGKSGTIQPQAFDQLFQKMNLGRPYAIMAYKYLTDNGTKPLDADKIDSIVKAVITSSDDENDSHFLLPGFFKTIANNKNNEKDNKNKTPSSVQEKEQSEANDKYLQRPSTSSPPPSPPTSTPPSQPQQSNTSSVPLPQEQQKPKEPSPPPSSESQQQNVPTPPSSQSQQQNVPTPPSSQSQQQNVPTPPSSQSQQQNIATPPSVQEKKPDNPPESQKQPTSNSQNGAIKPPTTAPSTNQQQNVPPPPSQIKPQNNIIQQEDDNIRHLLRYYHIDDGDIVEVAGGSVERIVLVHPERPLPLYIQQNKQLLQKIQSYLPNFSSVQQNGLNNNGNSPQETKPQVTLEERVSRGEAQKGPTVPSHQDQKQENSSSTDIRQVYPQLTEAQQEEQQKQAKLQTTQSDNNEKQTKEEPSIANDVSLSSKQDETKSAKDITDDNKEKIIAEVLKQLTPIVEKRVAAELRRIQSGDTEEDEDEDENMMQFPFMFGGGGIPFFAAPQGGPPPQGQTSQQNAANRGQQDTAAFLHPQLLMAMMNDLARGGMGGEIHGFPHNMPPPPQGPTGVEGFMMFVDDDQLMGGPHGPSLPSNLRF